MKIRLAIILCSIGLVSAGITQSTSVSAQSNDAISRQLFEQARQLAANGQFEQACPKFEDAYRLHPGLGILLNLADCWEHINRTASAWAAFMRVVDEGHRSKQVDRERIARERADLLKRKLSHLLIQVDSTDPGLEVIRDGVVVGSAQWGVALPVDPGTYVVEARAPSKTASKATVEVQPDAKTVVVVIPPLTPDPAAVAPGVPGAGEPDNSVMPVTPDVSYSPTPVESTPTASADSGLTHGSIQGSATPSSTGPAPLPPTTHRPELDAKSSGGSQATVGWIVGSTGLAGLAVGTLFALQVSAKNNDADQICSSGLRCTSADKRQYESAISDAKSARDRAMVGFAIGGAALAAGAILILTAPNQSTTALHVAPAVDVTGRLAVSLRGAF